MCCFRLNQHQIHANIVKRNHSKFLSMFQIVVVPDADTAKNVPSVPGLIAYHKDNKELYLRGNKTWNVIAQEKKVQ